MTEPTVFRADRRRGLIVLILGWLFVLEGIVIVAKDSLVAHVIGAFCLFWFGLVVLIGTWWVIRAPIMLTIGGDGVRIRNGWHLTGPVPWDAIAAAEIFRYAPWFPLAHGSRMLGLVPADPRSALWQRRTWRWSQRIAGAPVTIAHNTKPELEEIVAAMHQYKDLPLTYEGRRGVRRGHLTR